MIDEVVHEKILVRAIADRLHHITSYSRLHSKL
jgi:hypothetical protein